MGYWGLAIVFSVSQSLRPLNFWKQRQEMNWLCDVQVFVLTRYSTARFEMIFVTSLDVSQLLFPVEPVPVSET
jgi:hypothetical protein